MAKPLNQHPSAHLLAELEKLRFDEGSAERSERVWRIVIEASAQSDFHVLHDFAIEHELIQIPPTTSRARAEALPVGDAIWVNPIDKSEMVWISAGAFKVGKENQSSELRGFSLARHPVTNLQFQRFLQETNYWPSDSEDHPNPETFLRHWHGGNIPRNQEKFPVTWVSYIDALNYCKWAGLTLPTEWMWEKAARGADGRNFPWGNVNPTEAPAALTNIDSAGLVAVGSYPRTRSPFGCEDLIGNVSEWCQTTKGDDPSFMPGIVPLVPPIPKKADVLTIVRGSCYLRAVASNMVSAHRRRLAIIRRNKWVGFRPACVLESRPVSVT